MALGAPLWAQDPSAGTPPATPPVVQPDSGTTPPAVAPREEPPTPPAATIQGAGDVRPATTPGAAPVQEPAAQPMPALPAAWDARYRTHEDIAVWTNAWVATGLAEAVVLPASRSGRSTPALQFGAPGERPLAERPTVFLLGGLDGVSLAGCEGVVRAVDDLLRARGTLPPSVAFVCVPWASPDGLARTLAGEPCDGRDRLAVDDDGDLVLDEDGPDDVDGDGQILEMLVEDPNGPWTRGSDARFLVRAASGDRLRYTRSKEGRDDDGDGRFNEDPEGGVVLDLAFPVGWTGEPGGLGGALPLDDDLSRALADLMRARPPLAVLAFQGNHGMLARAGGVEGLPWSDGPGTRADAAAVRLFAESTQRAQTDPIALRLARGESRPGAALDWIHSVVGALACEVGVWGPLDERVDPRGTAGNPRAEPRSVSAAEASAPNTEGAWARWLDDVRGGIGFVDWHLVDLGDNRTALVGGWLPLARANPPKENLEVATQGLAQFVKKLAVGAPNLELRVVEASRDGEVVTVRARLENTGRLPTGLGGAEGARVTLELPNGARLLWGELDARLGVLDPGATSREITAVVLVPPGGTLKLAARAPWAAPVTREVKP
ncbi:MAG: hypothetical protein NTY35_10920 [Planctomycetota bacterium]|nr:hypothetical protein [Planctomycetota bacterium]